MHISTVITDANYIFIKSINFKFSGCNIQFQLHTFTRNSDVVYISSRERDNSSLHPQNEKQWDGTFPRIGD